MHLRFCRFCVTTPCTTLTTMPKILEGTSYSQESSNQITSQMLDDGSDASDDFSFITDRKQKGKLF